MPFSDKAGVSISHHSQKSGISDSSKPSNVAIVAPSQLPPKPNFVCITFFMI